MKRKLLKLLIIPCLGMFNCPDTKAQVKINEYSCSNTTFVDNFGETPDWVELYNAGGSTVNLEGYFLSDKKSNPTKWAFPAGVTIAPGSFVRIWNSAKDTMMGINACHTNFKLTQTQPEALVFSDAGGSILDSMTLIPTQSNHSRGRATNGSSIWALFLTPTPNASNAGPLLNYATRPSFSVDAGFYSGSQSVGITSPDASVSIYYTLDGTTPTTSSNLYSTPLTISATTVLRARAFSTNPLVPPSFINSNTYFISVTHTVPVVSVFGDQVSTLLNGTQLVAETGLEYFNNTGAVIAETFGTADEHGNDSWAYSQRGFDYISKDEMGYNYAVNAPVFSNKDRQSYQRLIFKAAANDNYPFQSGGAHIRDAFCHTLSQRGKLNLDERTWAPAVLYVNGQYWGVYDVREKVDDLDFTDHYYDQDEPDVQFLQTWGGTWAPYGDPQAQTDWAALRTFITSNSMAIQANYNYVDSVFNIKSFVDYFVFNSWLVTADWLNYNTAWWRGLDPDGDKKKWRYALWDLDAVLGHYINYTGVPDPSVNADPCNVEDLPDPGGQGHTQILNALMANPDFKQYYQARYVDLMNTSLHCSFILPLYDSMINVIAPEMPGQIAKWGGSVSAWETNHAAFRLNLAERCFAIISGMVDCYTLTGPYAITVDVQPPGAGDVKINSITPSSYYFYANYYGGMNTLLEAKPNPGYTFDHWEFLNHTPSPNFTQDSVAVEIMTVDNIVAVFIPPASEADVVAVPSGFSPNGDGNHDILNVLGEIENIDFVIYNRWGQQVFRTRERSQGWDGKFNGQMLNAGVFAYRLSGDTPKGKIEKKGNITLVR